MLHTISNAVFSATISSVGAELKSFKDTAQNDEYLWQGDANIWQGSAPILFPIVGRLKNGQYQYQGKSYQLNKHGFARTSTFTVAHQQSNTITFALKASELTKDNYPFGFVLLVKFTLDGAGLRVSYEVQNTGHDMMYFTLGSHPALSLPVDNARLEDYWVEFDQHETVDCYLLENNLLSNQPIKAYLNHQKTIPIDAELFQNDALIFKNIQSKKVSLKHRKTGHRVTMHTGSAPHFGLWAKPNAPFICFEPWFSYDDAIDADGELSNKPGILPLEPGEQFNTEYQLNVS